MEQNRKIVIPLGAEPETPHFDAEETLLSARPVVPLAPSESQKVSARPRVPFYKRLAFLALIVFAAIGIGVVGGLGIARYQYQKTSAAPVAARPAQTDSRTATAQTPGETRQAQVPSVPEVKISDQSRDEQPETDDDKAPASSTKASDNPKDKLEDKKKEDDNKTTKTPAPREKTRTDDDEDENISRAQRRERRRRTTDDLSVPRQIERASEQVNRIREIFEGQQRP